MKIFVINLDKNVDRLEKCKMQFSRLGLTFERFPAVFGKALSVEEKRRSVNRFLWWCAGGRPVMDGEIGCALSHLGVYRKMMAENVDVACVFEDDVVLDDRLPNVLPMIERRLDSSKSQVFLLSNHTTLTAADGEFVEVRSASFADGYVLTGLAAKTILNENYPLRVAADTWTRWIRKGVIRCYRVFPPVCRQDWSEAYQSDVCDDRYDPAKFSLWGKMLHKGGRLLGKIIDMVVP